NRAERIDRHGDGIVQLVQNVRHVPPSRYRNPSRCQAWWAMGRHAGEATGGGLGEVEPVGIVEREATGRGEHGRYRLDGTAKRDFAEATDSGVGDVVRRWQAWGMRINSRERLWGVIPSD